MSITMSRGQAYIQRLNDERNVWLDGERIQVTGHQAFQGNTSNHRRFVQSGG